MITIWPISINCDSSLRNIKGLRISILLLSKQVPSGRCSINYLDGMGVFTGEPPMQDMWSARRNSRALDLLIWMSWSGKDRSLGRGLEYRIFLSGQSCRVGFWGMCRGHFILPYLGSEISPCGCRYKKLDFPKRRWGYQIYLSFLCSVIKRNV